MLNAAWRPCCGARPTASPACPARRPCRPGAPLQIQESVKANKVMAWLTEHCAVNILPQQAP